MEEVLERRTGSEELHLIACGREDCAPDKSYGPALRSYHMIHFVTAGQGHLYLDDRHFAIGPGQCFFVPTDTLSLYKAEPSDPWRYCWICFDGSRAPEMIARCHLSLAEPVRPLDDVGEIAAEIDRMLTHPALTPAAECHLQSGLYRIFAHMMDAARAVYNPSEPSDNIYVTQAISYMLHHSKSFLTVADVAEHLHISRTHLFNLFKKHLGSSPQHYLTTAKIAHARELLARTELPIAEVAAASGYRNPFSFSRAFHQIIGLSPTDYREKYRKVEELLQR